MDIPLFDSVLQSDQRAIMQSPATASYKKRVTDEDTGDIILRETRVKGALLLTDRGEVIFARKKLLRGYERDHWYGPSEIVSVRGASEGLAVDVLYPETHTEPAAIFNFFYEIGGDVNQWLSAVSQNLKSSNPSGEVVHVPQKQVILKEREIIREIVKVRCSHCGNPYEERLDRCPHCGGR